MAATAVAGDLSNTVTVQKETASGIDVAIDVTITTVDAPEFSRGSDGKAFYLLNGTPYENKTADTVGEYQLTVAWHTGDQAKWVDSGAVASYLDITLTAKSQADVDPNTDTNKEPYAVLLKTGSEATTDENDVASSHTFRVIIASAAEGGNLSFKTDGNYSNCTPTNLPSSKVNGLFGMRPGREDGTADTFTADDDEGEAAKQMTYTVDLFDIA